MGNLSAEDKCCEPIPDQWSALPVGVCVPTGQRNSQTEQMTARGLTGKINSYPDIQWKGSPEYAEVAWRLLNWSVEELEVAGHYVPVWKWFGKKEVV